MFGYGYSISKPLEQEPGVSSKLVQCVADSVCGSWRRDAEIQSSIPWVYDHQQRCDVKVPATAGNFVFWRFIRDAGLVRDLRIAWGQHAIDGNPKLRFAMPESFLAICVTVTVDPTRLAVPGGEFKNGTTKSRMCDDILTACKNIVLASHVNVVFEDCD